MIMTLIEGSAELRISAARNLSVQRKSLCFTDGCALLVSIIINNYNYARYLACAIDSALAQTYPLTEVIVVDDGSTDASPAIIAGYGDRIIPVLQANGGQAAALNAGFAHSHGDVIFFLDADDMLHPEIVTQTVARLRAAQEWPTCHDKHTEWPTCHDKHDKQSPYREGAIVRVQYRLGVIDAEGVPTGETMPPCGRAIPCGDLRNSVLAYGDDIPWLPTSGNAFRADVLRQIFPIPVDDYRICADYYLSNLTPLFGPVAALDIIGGYYRTHAANHHHATRLNLEQVRRNIVRTARTHVYLQATAWQESATRIAAHPQSAAQAQHGIARYSVTFVANRLVSLRLEPNRHPLSDDTRLGLLRRGIWAALRRPGLTMDARAMYLAWFLAVALAPHTSLVRWLAERLFFPHQRARTVARVPTRLARPSISVRRG